MRVGLGRAAERAAGEVALGDVEADRIPDVNGFVHEYSKTDPIYKAWFPVWNNPDIDKLVDDGLATVDQAKRHDIYKQIQTILLAEFPHVPLLVATKYQVTRSRLKNMYVSYTDFNPGLREAWVEG